MATKLIQLTDGTLIEVEANPDEVQQVAFSLATSVDKTIERVKPILIHACQPVIEAWNDLSRQVSIEQAEVELGLSFEGEGNVYITKAKAGANLTIRLALKQKPESDVPDGRHTE